MQDCPDGQYPEELDELQGVLQVPSISQVPEEQYPVGLVVEQLGVQTPDKHV